MYLLIQARAEVGLAPSSSDAELARRKAYLEEYLKCMNDAARAVENALAAQKSAVEMSEYTYTATWGQCNREFAERRKVTTLGLIVDAMTLREWLLLLLLTRRHRRC